MITLLSEICEGADFWTKIAANPWAAAFTVVGIAFAVAAAIAAFVKWF